MLRFPFKLAHNTKGTEVLTTRTWEITAIAIPFTTEVKGSSLSCSVLRKCQVHVCTHVPCFLNATEATQFSGSWHFQLCLPATSSSCLFLPNLPPGLGCEVILAFTYCTHMFNASVSLTVVPKFAHTCPFMLPSSSYRLISIVANPSIIALSTSSMEGAPIILRFRVDHQV